MKHIVIFITEPHDTTLNDDSMIRAYIMVRYEANQWYDG